MREETAERALIGFHDLTPDWQAIAVSNIDAEFMEDTRFIEPCAHHIPDVHALLDLNSATPNDKDGAIIPVSNNSAIELEFSDCYDFVTITHI